MIKILVGFLLGVFMSTVGLQSLAKMADNSVHSLQRIIRAV